MPLLQTTVPLASHAARLVAMGEGPAVVVLLHGFTDSWRSFELVLPALARKARCVALDQRGHGASLYEGDDHSLHALAQDVIDVLGSLGVQRASIVGHSMGSFVARAVALRRPRLVERLVLVGSGTTCRNDVVRSLERAISGLPEPIPRPFAEEFQASCVFERASVPEDFFQRCVDVSRGTSPRTWRGVARAMIEHDDPGELRGIACPTLVLGGEHDGVFSAGDQRDLARAIPGATLNLYADAGHSPHWERPERFARDVVSFLA